MNIVRKLAVAAAFLCAATVANAEGTKIGAKVQYFAVQPTGDGAEDADMSFLGLGAGLAVQIPLGVVSLNPGVELYYSKPFNQTIDMGGSAKTEISISELGIAIPVIAQYDISGAYVGGGLQLGLPISSKMTQKATFSGVTVENTEDTPDRATLDLGLAIVAGYNVSDNISVGAKGVIGLTETAEDAKVKYNQYCISATYFF